MLSMAKEISQVRPATLSHAIPDQMYVYTDIYEPYTVGDNQSFLLRIVPLVDSNYRFGPTLFIALPQSTIYPWYITPFSKLSSI